MLWQRNSLATRSAASKPRVGQALRTGRCCTKPKEHFDALLSMDRGLAHQQNPSGLGLRILIIRAPSNRMVDLRPLVDSILTRLAAMRPGQLEVVQSPRGKSEKRG